MGIECRTPADDDERRALLRLISAAFGDAWTPPSPERQALTDRLRDRNRELVVLDGGRIVAGCLAYDLELTLPGGATVPVAGLAGVGVDPTRTGRGLLRHVMAAHLADARRRGEAASALLASESGLYRRFGYGWSTSMAVYEATSRAAGLREPLDDRGSLELLADPVEARAVVSQVYARLAGRVAGTTSRSPAWWEVVFGADESWLGGGPQLAVVHRDAGGQADGYLLYRNRHVDTAGSWVADDVAVVRELVGLDVTAELALWDFACRIPLTRRVRWELAPVDTPVRWHLADPRQLKTVALHDLLWLRPLDLRRLLERRRYQADGRVCFGVEAPDDEDLHGPWTLDVDGGAATVERGGTPSVRLPLAAVGSLVLGEVRAVELAAAGVVTGDDAAVMSLSTLLATDRRPFSLSKF